MSPIHDDEPGDPKSPIGLAITHARVSAACSAYAVSEPQARIGLTKAADKHRDQSRGWLNEVTGQDHDGKEG